jgi:hypothetical protein
VISAPVKHVAPRYRALALVLVLFASGCGSSVNDLSSGVQGTAKPQTEEERYRYEGTGNVKQKTRIRRESERFKELTGATTQQG